MLYCSFTLALFSLLFSLNRMMFSASHFFPKNQSCYYASSKKRKFSPLGSMFISGLSDREARKLSGAKGAKRQTSYQRGARMPGQRRDGKLVFE